MANTTGWQLKVRKDVEKKKDRPAFVYFENGIERTVRWADQEENKNPKASKYPKVPQPLLEEASRITPAKMLQFRAKQDVAKGKQKQIVVSKKEMRVVLPPVPQKLDKQGAIEVMQAIIIEQASGNTHSVADLKGKLRSRTDPSHLRENQFDYMVTAANHLIKGLRSRVNDLHNQLDNAYEDESSRGKIDKLEDSLKDNVEKLAKIERYRDQTLLGWLHKVRKNAKVKVISGDNLQEALLLDKKRKKSAK